MNDIQNFSPKLIKKIQLTDDASSFYFEKPDQFDFIPGQYIKMILDPGLTGVDIKNPDDRGTSRFFTVAASSTEKDLMITTRIIQSAFKKTLNSLPIGSQVQMRGPFGQFSFDEKDLTPRVYLAGGIGITPARSMMIYARDKNLKIPMTLLASFSTEEEVVFRDELTSLNRENLKAIFIITKESGRLDVEKIRQNVEDFENAKFYISGPAPFVEAMEKLVSELKINNENIKSEDFPGY